MTGGGTRVVAAALIALAAASATAAPATASPPTAAPAAAAPAAHSGGKVLIVSVPTVTWRDVRDERLPAVRNFLRTAAVANLSVRAIGGHTDIDEGYATIGAGTRARGAGALGGYAADVTDQLAEGSAVDAYRRRVGRDPRRAAVVQLGYPVFYRVNDKISYGAHVGALGQTAVRTAVVGNADLGPDADRVASLRSIAPGDMLRPAAVAVMDRSGRVDHGTVGTELLAPDARAPFGVRLDVRAATVAARRAWPASDVVVVEASDLVRADQWRPVASKDAFHNARRRALRSADRLLGALLPMTDGRRDLVVLLAPSAGGHEELTVFAARARGLRPGALLHSPSTRRSGYVTLPDVAPTALHFLGVKRPTSMTGRTVDAGRHAASITNRVDQLADADSAALFRDRVSFRFTTVFIVLHATVSFVAILIYWGSRRASRPIWLATTAVLLLAIPVSSFLVGLLPVWRWGPAALVGLVAMVAGVVAAGAWRARRLPLGPPMVVASTTVAVLVADGLTGGRLQIGTVFGYSPIVAGRFQGFGNAAFSLLAASTVMVAAWVVLLRGRSPAIESVILLLLVGVVIADGAPQFGSDVGGILATIPAFGVTFLVLTGRRVSWRRLATLAAVLVVALAVAIAVDVSRPESAQTHLGRLAEQTVHGGPSSLGTVIKRKATANLGVLGHSPYTYLVPFLLGFLALLVWRPPSLMAELVDRYPALRAGIIGLLVAAVLGFALNDSGVAVPAMMLAVLNSVLLYAVTTLPPATGVRADAPSLAAR